MEDRFLMHQEGASHAWIAGLVARWVRDVVGSSDFPF